MTVRLIFDAQFCGRVEATTELPDDASEEEIRESFSEILGIDFDDNCSWVIEPKE